MALDPSSVGAKGEPTRLTWTSKDALLYAVGVGAGTNELALGMSHYRALRPLVDMSLVSRSCQLCRKLVVSGTVPFEERLIASCFVRRPPSLMRVGIEGKPRTVSPVVGVWLPELRLALQAQKVAFSLINNYVWFV